MKNYKRIHRLFEDEMIANPDQTAVAPMTPVATAAPVSPEPLPEPSIQPELPAATGPMDMKVSDFIAKCKEIDPLVCMGIESFIEKNSTAFGQGAVAFSEPDITFSNQVPTSPEPAQSFSDMPDDSFDFPA